jgi:hypothetical protein
MTRPTEWYIRQVSASLFVEISMPQPVAVAIDRKGGGLVMVTLDELRELAATLARVMEDIDTYMAETGEDG